MRFQLGVLLAPPSVTLFKGTVFKLRCIHFSFPSWFQVGLMDVAAHQMILGRGFLRSAGLDLFLAAPQLWTPANSFAVPALPAPPPHDYCHAIAPVLPVAHLVPRARARPPLPRPLMCRRCQGRGHREAICPSPVG